MTNIEEEVKELQKIVKEHAYRYYVLNDPIISDEEYDKLYHNLRKLEERYLPEEDRITNKVACGVSSGSSTDKVKHEPPMLSLDNAFSVEDLLIFFPEELHQTEIVITPKYDGASLSLVYEDGILKYALRRGDGIEGNVITNIVSGINGISLTVPKEVKVVRGEVVCPSFSNEFAGKYKNHRNFVAGSLNLKDLEEVKKRNLLFLAYDVFGEKEFDLYSDKLNYLNSIGFSTVADEVMIISSIGDFNPENVFNTVTNAAKYPIDGVVIRINEESRFRELGATAHHPKGAVAFKLNKESAITKIVGVEWQVGKSGIVTPVAVLNPVELNGTTVKRCTLHNINEIERLDLAIGDTVEIIKAAFIIPKIVAVVERGSDRQKIAIYTCPSCNSKLVRDGAYLKCTNKDCQDQIKRQILQFFKTLKVDGFGDRTVESIINHGYKTLPDILSLSKEQLTRITGSELIGEKLWNNLQRRLKEVSFVDVVAALNIPGVNRTMAKKLVDAGFDTIYKMVDYDKLLEVKGIGPKRATEISDAVYNMWNELPKLEKFLPLKTTPKDVIKPEVKIAITGKLPKSRTKLKELLREKGVELQDNVTQNTDMLILGEKPGKDKIEKAKKYGIPIVDFYDSEYRTLLGL